MYIAQHINNQSFTHLPNVKAVAGASKATGMYLTNKWQLTHF